MTAGRSTCLQRHRRRSTFPLPITTWAPYTVPTTNCDGRTLGTLTRVQRHYQSPPGRHKHHSLDTPSSLHTSYYQTPRGHRKYTLFGHPLFLLPSTTGAPHFAHPSSSTNLHRRTLFRHTLASTHFSTTNLHRRTNHSYGRSTAFGLSRSLSRV